MPIPDINDKEKRYTYADYITWDEHFRCELIDGKIVMMSPSPAQNHQRILGEIFVKFHAYLKGKKCKLFMAPSDVRLNPAFDNDVVQPDLFVVCDDSKLDGNACNGAPDLVIEILSQSTAKKDCVEKLLKYLNYGVKEYWIVDPESQTITVHLFQDGKSITSIYKVTDSISSAILEGLNINLKEVFEES